MAKHRGKKPPKKREQPWMQAARDKLRGPSTHEAFAKFASVIFGPFARTPEAQLAFDAARFAWNLPLLHALSTEPGSDGAKIRADAEPWLAILPERLPILTPLFAQRNREFASFRQPIVDARVSPKSDGDYTIDVTLGDRIGDAELIGIEPSGWPDPARSLVIVSEPMRALLPDTFPDEASRGAASDAIALASFAWNHVVVDRPKSDLRAPFRAAMAEGARHARELPAPMPAIFESMCETRRTRFAYDPRLFFAFFEFYDGEALLNVRPLDEEDLDPHASIALGEPDEDWFPSLRALIVARSAAATSRRQRG